MGKLINFSKELLDKINKARGIASFTAWVIEACEEKLEKKVK